MTWNLDATQFTAAVADAGRAPSVHNTQPWRFQLTGPAIEVHLDPARLLRTSDPTGRNARISCGAATYTLALALANHGTPAVVTIPADGTLIARLTPGPPRQPTPQQAKLYRAVPRRHSNRQPFLDTAVPAPVRTALIEAARAEGGWLELLGDHIAVNAAADLIRTADRILAGDAGYGDELRSWTRTDPQATDGVLQQLGGPASRPDELLVRRDFGGTGRPQEFEREPTLAALGVPGQQPPDDVRAGMALQRVLLTATDLGLAASMFTQPIDVATVRDELAGLLGRAEGPHVLLRFGYTAALFATARRPAADTIG